MTATRTDRLNGISDGVAIKAPCRVATIGNITLDGLQTVDGIALAAGDRVLVKAQTNTAQNGVYVVSTGLWTRAPDFDGARDIVEGTLVPVNDGSSSARKIWRVTTSNPAIGSALTFAKVFMEDFVSVKDFDVVGDGTTVDTANMQAALDSFGASGGRLYIPNDAKIRLGSITVPANVCVFGPHVGLDVTINNIDADFSVLGGALLLNPGANITLGPGASVEGCAILKYGMTFPQPDSFGWTDTAVTVAGYGAKIKNNLILGFDKGVLSNGYSRVSIIENYIDANNGVDVIATYDSTRILNNQLWPFATHQSFWESGESYAARDKTKLYRTGFGIRLKDGSDDTHVDGNLTNGHLVGLELQNLASVNGGRHWSDHPFGSNRTGNSGVWVRNNVVRCHFQTVWCWGVKNGIVVEQNPEEDITFDLVHAEFIDANALAISAGDVRIGHLSARQTGGPAVSIGTTAARVYIGGYRFANIGSAQPIFLPTSMTASNLFIGRGQWDGAEGGSLIGSNPLIFQNIASADPLPLPVNGLIFRVSGTTSFGQLTGGWGSREVTLIFEDSLTVFDGGNMDLAGNFSATAGDTLRLLFDGGSGTWLEISRSGN
jgi:hypothetical protein